MRNAVVCDLRTLLPFLPSVGVTLVLVCAFLTLGGGALSAVGSVCAMTLLLCMFSLGGYDDQNGWGRFRATLPLSRREVVVGRYLAVLALGLVGVVLGVAMGMAFQAVVAVLPMAAHPDVYGLPDLFASSVASMACGLVICSVAMPFCVKYGAIRGARIFACAVAVAASLAIAAGMNLVGPETLAGVGAWVDANVAACVAIVTVVAAVAYAASCAVSLRIYGAKDL